MYEAIVSCLEAISSNEGHHWYRKAIIDANGLLTKITCLLTDRDEMSNLHRGHSINASYQVSVHLAKRFQRRFLKIGQSETRIACDGHVW